MKTNWKLELKENRRKMAVCETTPRFDVVLNGAVVGELYYNMRGYVGSLPTPDGHNLSIGERGISAYRKEVGALNREAKNPRIKCDRCEMLSINGVACHEHGCPNAGKVWMPDEGDWVKFLECRECGCEVREGDACNCTESEPDEEIAHLFGEGGAK